ncbi:glutathione S-transferase family protein [Enterovirga aerilata]|uniref:Glutathione S-transferase n=1 Tax=Enterovirga aerilata TaxID=2730920 RepID=A0A849I6U6_9HYPH|nr:glutathione S-transferase N-terminal domain-containing protein [Enterovirga sp. DB1703]NNM71757.1 glutathione S-transferase [Enterovirga sp. DB1703]
MKLYYSPGACSLAPHIALEEAAADYEPVLVKLAEGAQRQPDYLAINPKGRVPALADDGFVVTENPAVLRYIARKFPTASLWPDDPRDEARCVEWLGWCASTIHVAYAHVRRPERYAASDAAKADVVEKARETCRDVWGQVEKRLAASSSDWAAGGEYSVADPYVFLFWTWGRGPALGFDMARDFPAWTAHATRMGERPAVQRALEREGIALP